jgi:hypothetical protein
MSNFGFVSCKRWPMRPMSAGGLAVKFHWLQIWRYEVLGPIMRSSKVKESGKVIWKLGRMNLNYWMILKFLKADH